MKPKLLTLLLLLILISTSSLSSQGLYLEASNGEVSSLNISDINSAVFPENNLVFNLTNTSTQTFSLLMLKKIYFADNTSIGNESPDVNNLLIYPNPAQSMLYISNLPEGVSQVKCYTVWGNQVLSACVSTENNSINIKDLPKGLYVLKVNNLTAKLVKN